MHFMTPCGMYTMEHIQSGLFVLDQVDSWNFHSPYMLTTCRQMEYRF